MPHAYTEDQLVEQPAMFDCFAPLGWTLAGSRNYPPEVIRDAKWVDEIGLFGRETTGEVVLVSRLRAALERLDPALAPDAITAAVAELTRDLLLPGLLSEQNNT